MDRATTRKLSGRIATPPDRAYPWYVRLIFALQRRKYGAELQSARLWGRLPRVFFDEQAVLELTALIAFQNLSSKFNAAFALPAQGLCAVPEDIRK